jgi:hypothetical protein
MNRTINFRCPAFKRLYFAFFFNTSALTASLALEIELCPADAAYLMQFDRFDIRGEQGKGPFHAYPIGDLANRKSRCMARTLAFDHVALESLNTLFIAFHDLIIDGDIVTGFEFREVDLSCQLLVYECYCGLHGSIFLGWQRYQMPG